MKRNTLFIVGLLVLMMIVFTPGAPPINAWGISREINNASGSLISGRVIDNWGTPVQGVTIQAIGCDLSKQPVLLVHDWSSPEGLSEDGAGFAKLYMWMAADGYILGCNLFYATGLNISNTRDQNRLAIQENLHQAYDLISIRNPEWRGHFDIIGHGFGGLFARFYLESDLYQADQSYSQYGIHIDNLFSLGSPHAGILIPQETYPGTGYMAAGHLLSPYTVADFISMAHITNLNMDWYNTSHQQPEEICYRMIGGDFLMEDDLPWGIQALYSPYSAYPGDIAISLRSSGWLEGIWQENVYFPKTNLIINQDLHGDYSELGLEGLDSYVNPQVTYVQSIREYLGQTDCPETIFDASVLTGSDFQEPTYLSPVLLAKGDLISDQTATGEFPIDWYGTSVFYAIWQGGPLDLTLTDPLGSIITPTVAESDPNIQYGEWFADQVGFSTYVFTSTLSGPWSYSLSPIDAPNPILYSLFVYPETDLVLHASTSEWQMVGTPAVITATFTQAGAPVSGIITATVTLPDSSLQNIVLTDDGLPPDVTIGDGSYTGVFQATTQPGFYSVFVKAEGNYPSQISLRTTQTYFLVSPLKAAIRDSFSATPVDVDGNGYYEYLEVQIGLLITETGRLELSAVLQGGSDQFIDLDTSIEDISATGQHTMTLIFSGDAIRRSGLDGPYAVENMMLLDDDHLLLVDASEAQWLTEAYQHGMFGTLYSVNCPLIVFSQEDPVKKPTVIPEEHEISVIASAVYSRVTDGNGIYTFSELPEGAYIIIPTQGEQNIEPVYREVIIPPDATNQNFTLLDRQGPGEMIYIPAGEFWMGCDQNNNAGYECNMDEIPPHPVYLDAYYIDKYLITNAQFAQCVAAGSCIAPANQSSWSRLSYYDNPEFANYPVINIPWQNAQDYCTWSGKRLLTEAEWEKAARGTSMRVYPWGNIAPNCSLANSYDDATSTDCVGDTSEVGSYPLGSSPYGVLDMAGNVWEWLHDWYLSTYYEISPYSNPTGPTTGTVKVLHGGGWHTRWEGLRSSDRLFSDPVLIYANVGFRCGATPDSYQER